MAFYPLFNGKLRSLASSFSLNDTMPTPSVTKTATKGTPAKPKLLTKNGRRARLTNR
jgi:hypothetical protein